MEISVGIQGADEAISRLQAVESGVRIVTRQVGVIGNTLPYAPYVHNGTRPHDILPRRARALFWPGARHPVARVHHPGYRGNPYLTDAAASSGNLIENHLTTAITAVAQGGSAEMIPRAFADAIQGVRQEAVNRANMRTGALRRDITAGVR